MDFSHLFQRPFLCIHLQKQCCFPYLHTHPDLNRKNRLIKRGVEKINLFFQVPQLPHPTWYPLSPWGQQGSIYIFSMVQKFLKYRENSNMHAYLNTILAAQPFLFEGGLHSHPLTIRNSATWHLNSWAKDTWLNLYLLPNILCAPKGQPIQGGDRSKTLLLILSYLK